MKIFPPTALFLLLASLEAPAQQMLQGPGWKDREVAISGHVIGYKPGHEPGVGCVLVQADIRQTPQGRVWACSQRVHATMAQWTTHAQSVRIHGRVTSLQKTRMGSSWRFVPRMEHATIAPIAR